MFSQYFREIILDSGRAIFINAPFFLEITNELGRVA
jgi:hypothetical protein